MQCILSTTRGSNSFIYCNDRLVVLLAKFFKSNTKNKFNAEVAERAEERAEGRKTLVPVTCRTVTKKINCAIKNKKKNYHKEKKRKRG